MAKQKGKYSFSNAAYFLLRENGRPMFPSAITKEALAKGLIKTSSKRPEATMGARIRGDGRFETVGGGRWKIKPLIRSSHG